MVGWEERGGCSSHECGVFVDDRCAVTLLRQMMYTVNMKLKDVPPLTQADDDRLAALAARPDSEIDLGDLPELGPEDWKNGVRGKHYR